MLWAELGYQSDLHDLQNHQQMDGKKMKVFQESGVNQQMNLILM
jgi:hypothetical protein